MHATAISGHHQSRHPIEEVLWVLAGVVLVFTFGDGLMTLLALAFATATVVAAWWIHRAFGAGRRVYATTAIGILLVAAAAVLASGLTFTATAQAAGIDNRFDICAALRSGTSLASIETTLEARGYSASSAGALTGMTIRQQCPDQAAGVMAQMQRVGA
jgi:hypothetical protein